MRGHPSQGSGQWLAAQLGDGDWILGQSAAILQFPWDFTAIMLDLGRRLMRLALGLALWKRDSGQAGARFLLGLAAEKEGFLPGISAASFGS